MRLDLKNPNELTLDNVREFIRSGDDSTHTQIRVTENGIAYLSDIVGTEGLDGVRFRMETFDPGNGYIGEDAANDDEWVNEVYRTLKSAWRSDRKGYVDY